MKEFPDSPQVSITNSLDVSLLQLSTLKMFLTLQIYPTLNYTVSFSLFLLAAGGRLLRKFTPELVILVYFATRYVYSTWAEWYLSSRAAQMNALREEADQLLEDIVGRLQALEELAATQREPDRLQQIPRPGQILDRPCFNFLEFRLRRVFACADATKFQTQNVDGHADDVD